jgi:hypoxia up-regulated 1
MWSSIRSAFALLLAVHVQVSNSNVIGIDFGSENMKVGIVSPGTPLDIVTNLQSKRKTPTYITFYRGERMFGADSYALMTRKPDLTFAKLFRMIGKTPEHPHLEELSSHYFPFEFFPNETTSVTSLKQEETYYTPEELLAMMMQHARDMTRAFGGTEIRDCVMTVPSFFSQHERNALYTAASIADFNVLSLIEENTAAALNFGMDRNFDEPTTVLFYNMGASSVQVSIVTFSSSTVKESGSKNKTVSQFEIVGKAWDSHLGGFSFDVKLAELLAERFNEAWVKKASKKGTIAVNAADYDVRKFSRPMARLRLEALKLKEVLSGNMEFPVKIEQLHADVDLITKVSRSDFEEHCGDLWTRLTAAVDGALEMADMTLANVSAVELIGGAVRMPKVKSTLDTFFRAADLELGQHLNGDEAMALGAALRGANLSTAFRVRKVGMVDTSSFSVVLNLADAAEQPEPPSGILGSVMNMFSDSEEKDKKATADASAEPTSVWTKHAALFPRRSPVPSKVKTVTFAHDKDIVCRLEYDATDETSSLLPPSDSRLIALYNITGIAQFAHDNAAKGIVGTPKVSLSFLLDGSGLVSLSKAEITMELAVEPEASVITPPEEEVAAEVAETAEAEAAEAAAESADAAAEPAAEGADAEAEEAATLTPEEKKAARKEKDREKAAAKKALKKDKKDKDRLLKRALKISYDFSAPSPPQYTNDMVMHSRSRLIRLDDIDRSRRAQEAALNSLEGYMLAVKNRLLDEADELSAVSTEESRAAVAALCDEVEEWLYGDGRDATVSVYKDKEKEVKTMAEPIFRRFTEMAARPEAVTRAKKQIEGIRKRVAKWADTMPQITGNETDKMRDLVDKAEAWIDEKEVEQSKKTPFDEPEFLSSDVASQMKPVATLLDRLLKKPKPVPPKVSANATNVNSTNNTSDANFTDADATADTTAEGTPSGEEVGEEAEASAAGSVEEEL